MSAVNGKRQGAWFGIEPEEVGDPRGLGGPFAGVVFNRPVEQVFTYRVPARLAPSIQPGQRVNVPLGRGNKVVPGYCVRVDAELPEGVEPTRLKEVVELLDDPALVDGAMLELTRWMASYYACS